MDESTQSDSSLSIRQARKPKHKKYVKWLWALLVIGILSIAGLFLLLSFGDLPTFEQLENPKSETATEIFASDGPILGRFFIENRIDVRYDELPQHLIDALVATEDARFYSHSGIDPRALARVLGRTVLGGNKSAGGGSTLSQQLAKLITPRPRLSRNPLKKYWVLGTSKLKEWITAVKLERSYTKDEIITMYFNKFNFIHGAYGIRSASEIYFGKTQDELSVGEAATLVGMLKNPSLFNPISRPDTTQHRREVVLSQMVKAGYLTQEAYDSIRVIPLDMTSFKKVDHNEGLAPYFREYLREDVKKLLKEFPKLDGSTYSIYEDGLKIYTTIDSRMQKHAEAAVKKHLSIMQPKFFKHWKKKDPWTHKDKEEITDEEIDRRVGVLTRQMRESERFNKRRDQFLKKTKELKFRDVDVDRMRKVENDRKQIMKWEQSGFIGEKLGDKYRKTFKNGDWDVIKKEWEDLDEAMEKEFDTPVPMTVFAYNERNEVDTIMSPKDSIKYYQMHLQSGFLAVEPQTGFVKAWVGGINHKYFKYDNANKSVARQIGSTFKPFLYAISIDLRGYSPCYELIDQPVTLEKGTFNLKEDWQPNNVGGYTNAPITLMQALKESKNSVSAFLMKDMGSPEPLRKLVGNMGVDLSRIPPVPSICLGTPDLSVFEMTGAYTAFANGGIVTKPVYISRIEDKNGNIIYEPVLEQKQVLSEQATYVMVQMLKNVIGGRLGLTVENGGKTGTTNSHADAWYMGVTPNLVGGTWVGCDDRWLRFRTLEYGQGARLARPIFKYFMRAVEADEELEFDKEALFPEPSGPVEIELDCTKYTQEGGGTPGEEFPGDDFERAPEEEEEEGGEFEFGEGGDDEYEDDEFEMNDYPGQRPKTQQKPESGAGEGTTPPKPEGNKPTPPKANQPTGTEKPKVNKPPTNAPDPDEDEELEDDF